MIAIITFNDLFISQYLYKYTAVLDKKGIPYEVIYWNRSAANYNDRGFAGKAIPYNRRLNSYQSFFKKAFAFPAYAAFVKRVINKRSYDKLIVLTSQTAIALFWLLNGKYRKKYLFDYRDITKETFSKGYTRLIQKLMRNAELVMVSSMKFLEFLNLSDTGQCAMAHNSQMWDYKKRSLCLSKSLPIRVAYWGMIRQVAYNKKICDLFGNDGRFYVTFHGDGFYEELESYCKLKGYNNISLTGQYNFLDDVPSFAAQTDLLHCVYENDVNTQPTLAVKLYDSIKYELPILVSKDSYLSEYLSGLDFALAVDPEKYNVDKVYDWYFSLQKEALTRSFARIRAKISEDDIVFERKVLEFVRGSR